MPTYDYKCAACGHQFERFQPITAAAVRKCPACGKLKVRRLTGCGAGVIFKGSGFYQTDYRSEAYRQAAKKESPSSSSGGSDGAKPDASAKKD
jgi:putative FmdB family regulatory protein